MDGILSSMLLSTLSQLLPNSAGRMTNVARSNGMEPHVLL